MAEQIKDQTAKTKDPWLVRLKPIRQKKTVLRRVHSVAGIQFVSDGGWYEVTDAIAEYCRELPERPNRPEGPRAFDVMRQSEAKIDEQREQRAKAEEAARAATPRITRSESPRPTEPRFETVPGLVPPRPPVAVAPPVLADGETKASSGP